MLHLLFIALTLLGSQAGKLPPYMLMGRMSSSLVNKASTRLSASLGSVLADVVTLSSFPLSTLTPYLELPTYTNSFERSKMEK